jgi:hypothetical protein
VITFKRNLLFIMLGFSLNACESFEDFTKASSIMVEGGHLQHHLIDEAIDVIRQMWDQDLDGVLREAITDLVNASIGMSKEGHVVLSSYALDACYTILDFTNTAAYYVHKPFESRHSVIESLINNGDKAFWFGSISSKSKAVVKTHDVLMSYMVMAYYLGKLAQVLVQNNIIYDILEMTPEASEKMLRKYMIDPTLVFTIYEKSIISEKNTGEIVDKECLRLLRGITKIFSIIPQKNWQTFLRCFYKGRQSNGTYETAGDILLLCSDEMLFLISIIKQENGIDATAELING